MYKSDFLKKIYPVLYPLMFQIFYQKINDDLEDIENEEDEDGNIINRCVECGVKFFHKTHQPLEDNLLKSSR